MIPVIRTSTPVLYVEQLVPSVAFYRLLGFEPVMSGDDGEWVYSYGRCGDVGLLLAQDGRTEQHRGPVQFYLQTDDLSLAQHRLEEAGVATEHLGYPDRAPGGELRVSDPDGRVLMVGQTTGAPPVDKTRHDSTSILHEAAETLRRRGKSPHECEVGEADGQRCREAAAVKLADGWGDSAWSCVPHADEVLFTVRGAFVATEDADGLGIFLTRRRRTR